MWGETTCHVSPIFPPHPEAADRRASVSDKAARSAKPTSRHKRSVGRVGTRGDAWDAWGAEKGRGFHTQSLVIPFFRLQTHFLSWRWNSRAPADLTKDTIQVL